MGIGETAFILGLISWLAILVLGPGALFVFVWAMLDLHWASKSQKPGSAEGNSGSS